MLVLLIDDDRQQGQLLQYWLENAGMYCIYVDSSEEAVKLLDRDFDVVVQDVARGDDSDAGLTLYWNHLEERGMPVILLTAYREEDLFLGNTKLPYLQKPATREEIIRKIKEVAGFAGQPKGA